MHRESITFDPQWLDNSEILFAEHPVNSVKTTEEAWRVINYQFLGCVLKERDSVFKINQEKDKS